MKVFIDKLNALEKLLKAQTTKNVLSLEEAAAFSGLSKSYLCKLANEKRITHYKPRQKTIYFKREEIEDWLMLNKVQTKYKTVEAIKIRLIPNPNPDENNQN